MARATQPTILPLDEVARLAGINPVHFNGATGGAKAWQGCGVCTDYWYQYAWQGASGFARENLARNIAEAEIQLEILLGYPLVPTLKTKLFNFVPYGQRGYWGEEFFSGGQLYGACCVPFGCDPNHKAYYLGHRLTDQTPKKWALIDTLTIDDENLTYADEDADEFAETAILTFTLPDSEVGANIGVFTTGHFGDRAWRISPIKSLTVVEDGDDYVFTLKIDAWQMIKPELWEEAPSAPSGDGTFNGNLSQCSMIPIDISDLSALVESVMVGHLVEDPGFPMVKFHYKNSARCGNPTCSICSMRTVTGCYADLMRANGFVIPIPATYDEDDGWCPVSTTTCCNARPSTVEISYFDGPDDYAVDNRYGATYNQALQQIVMLLAISRSQLGQCDCSCNAGQAWKKLSEDLTETKGAGRYLSFDVINNKFGLSRGEIMAYQRYSLYTLNKITVTAGASS